MKVLQLTPTELITMFQEEIDESKHMVENIDSNNGLDYDEREEFKKIQTGYQDAMNQAIKIVEVNTFDK